MSWQDNAYLLGVTKAGKNRLLLEILTERHGRQNGSITIDPSQKFSLLPASVLHVSVADDPLADPTPIEIQSMDGGLRPSSAEDIRLTILSVVGRIATQLLALRDPVQPVYAAMHELVGDLIEDNGRWPVSYARLELALLSALGHTSGLNRCRPAFRHGEVIYLAPRTGKALTRPEAGAFVDQMMPLPGFLLGGRRASVKEVVQALDVTRLLLEDFALADTDAKALPAARTKLLAGIEGLSSIPDEKIEDDSEAREMEAYKRRMLARRPLMVSGGVR